MIYVETIYLSLHNLWNMLDGTINFINGLSNIVYSFGEAE